MPYRPYLVRQGDHLTAIAARIGFDPVAVWNHPSNESLRAARPSMNVLAPGDVLHVPDRETRALAFSPGTTNRYRAALPEVRVAVMLKIDDAPIANETYVVDGLADRPTGTSGADGSVELTLPVWVREVTLVFPRLGRAFPLRIGHLDPVSRPTGVRQRLAHLGLMSWDAAGDEAEDARRERLAIAAFQRNEKLPVTGELDDQTRAALERAHRS